MLCLWLSLWTTLPISTNFDYTIRVVWKNILLLLLPYRPFDDLWKYNLIHLTSFTKNRLSRAMKTIVNWFHVQKSSAAITNHPSLLFNSFCFQLFIYILLYILDIIPCNKFRLVNSIYCNIYDLLLQFIPPSIDSFYSLMYLFESKYYYCVLVNKYNRITASTNTLLTSDNVLTIIVLVIL